MEGETIVALSTPPGESGIAVIRVSGARAREALDVLTGRHDWESHRIYHERLTDEEGQIIDEALVVLMKAPNSYTGEDVVEISCHGGLQVVSEILEVVMRQGVMPAAPGEFTRRAFMNGKLDLAQAEAVADLIAAETKLQRKVAIEHLEGGLSKSVRGIEEKILEHLALVELSIDFTEEDLPTYDTNEMMASAKELVEKLGAVLETEVAGAKLRRGIRITILGARNAGKSSLYNALIGEERAIVSPVPGTTRDLLRERIHIEGFTYYIEDTAGIAETGCEIEAKGISIGRRAARGADIVLFVIDGSLGPEESVLEELERIGGTATLCVLNKMDLGLSFDEKEAAKRFGSNRVIAVSAIDGTGLDGLRRWIHETSISGSSADIGREHIAVNARQADALRAASAGLERFIASAREGAPAELLSADLRSAVESCGLVTGRSVTGDLLDSIFSRFCIGK
jgi:tRNA modification GTPase